jgi:hypothetical protein
MLPPKKTFLLTALVGGISGIFLFPYNFFLLLLLLAVNTVTDSSGGALFTIAYLVIAGSSIACIGCILFYAFRKEKR